MKKVLLAGESWMSYTTHVKGFDAFYTSKYETGTAFISKAVERAGYEFVFLPNHLAGEEFPFTLEELQAFSCVILSDIGSNTLLLPPDTFEKSLIRPNRCNLIRDYVKAGGALLMIGGYMTFSGVDAKGKWHDTAVQEVLPVEVLTVDDRMEHCEGVVPVSLRPEHPVLRGLDGKWPRVLGYNRTVARPEAEILAEVEGDPFIAVADYGRGRSGVFTSDCAPHWAPPEFCSWAGYDILFSNLLHYLTRA